MICPDCGMTVESVGRKTGICTYCTRRKNNCSYRGVDYVPLIKIKGTSEYNRAMGRRLGTLERNQEKVPEVEEIKSEYEVIQTSNIEQEVEKDINKYIVDKGVKVDDNFLPLETIFEWFYGLCQKDNYISDLDLRRQIYDMLIVDYLHELKVSVTDRNYFADIGEKIAIVQQRRTPVDNEVDKYKVIEPIIKKLQEDEDFLKLLQETRIKLLEKVKAQENPKYISSTPSLQEHDYVVQPVDNNQPIRTLSKPTRQNKYGVEIKRVKGLYGNPTYQPFKYNSYIYANDETEAKKKFKSYMKESFPSLIYSDSDIVIRPWITMNSNQDKECL